MKLLAIHVFRDRRPRRSPSRGLGIVLWSTQPVCFGFLGTQEVRLPGLGCRFVLLGWPSRQPMSNGFQIVLLGCFRRRAGGCRVRSVFCQRRRFSGLMSILKIPEMVSVFSSDLPCSCCSKVYILASVERLIANGSH